MTTMPKAGFEHCGHEACDMEPCSAFSFMEYEEQPEFGWGTTCDRCERFYPGTLPAEHADERH